MTRVAPGDSPGNRRRFIHNDTVRTSKFYLTAGVVESLARFAELWGRNDWRPAWHVFIRPLTLMNGVEHRPYTFPIRGQTVCRFFAMRSTTPMSLVGALNSDPAALSSQSRCDRSGECHGSGWGIATYNGQPRVVRSTEPAFEDPLYAETASNLVATLALAHVRQASVGAAAGSSL